MKHYKLLLCLILSIAVCVPLSLIAVPVALAAPNASPNLNTWVTDGTVNEVVATSTTSYIRGSFKYVGPNIGCGVPIDTSTGQPFATYPRVDGSISVCVPDGAGGWYIGGVFTLVDNVTRSNIAHILPNGSLDPSWSPNANGGVYALAVSGSTVYAGGHFTSIGGSERNRIAAIDATTGNVTYWNPNANDGVFTLAVSGSTVYAGGYFTSIGGQTRNHVAALGATSGNATTWNPDVNNDVNALAVLGSTVYIGGDFTTIGVQTRRRIAAIDSSGLATSWNPDANGQVRAIAISGSNVYAGGYFTSIGGVATNYIAAWDSSTGGRVWTPTVAGLSTSYVNTIVVSGSTVYVGGQFTSIGGQERKNIAAWDSSTEIVTDWNPHAYKDVRALAVSGTTVYAGGYFSSIGGQARNGLAAIDAITGNATAWNPTVGGTVLTLAVSSSTVYVGGGFTSIGGQERSGIAALDSITGNVTSWNPKAGGHTTPYVQALAVSGSTVYAGGHFTNIGGSTRNNIAAIDAITGNATAWNPNVGGTVGGTVLTLAVWGSTVYVGGGFTNIGGQARNNIAAIDATGITPWNPNPNGQVCTLAASGSTVYVGGSFTNIGGQARNNIAAIDATTGNATAWNPNPNGQVCALAASGSTVYVGGQFSSLGGQVRNNIAAIDAITGNVTSWDPNVRSSSTDCVFALAVSGSTVYVGGDFQVIGGRRCSNFASVEDPRPTVTSITPPSWPMGSIASITNLAGTNFATGASVKLTKTGQPERNADIGSLTSTNITCTIDLTGAASGAWDVVVTNPDTQYGTLASGFTVTNPVPTTTGLSPASKTAGEAGFTLTVNGTNFVESSVVKWSDSDRTTTYVSDTQLTAAITAADIATAGNASVTVFNPTPGGGTSNAQTFTINPTVQTPTPAITSITPPYGPPGTQVNITGSGFGSSRGAGKGKSGKGASYVSFNGVQATEYPKWTDTEIVCVVPEGATPGPVVVVTGAGSSSAEKTFTVSYPTWYLAEGSTAWGYDCYISVENPNTTAVNVKLTYQTKSGEVAGPQFAMAAQSQATVNPRDTVGNTDFSTKVECTDGKTIAADRTMSWTGPGAASPEAHNSIGVTSPEKTWYLAEGSSNWGFECWLLIQNPNASEATCTVTYMIEGSGPQTVIKKVPASSRATFDMSKDIGQKDASIKVTSDVPVIPERAMYRNNRREGHDSIGTTTPASDYFLAEGTTAWGFTTYVLVQNPNDTAASVTVTYMTGAGPQPQAPFQMPANSRKTIRVNDVLPGKDLSTQVHADKPIIAERAMYWGAGTPLGEACHDSIGMASPHTTFYLPDGQTSEGRETWTLVQNPNEVEVEVEVSYLAPYHEIIPGPAPLPPGNRYFTATIPANSRRTFNMADEVKLDPIFPYADDYKYSIMVTSKTAGKPIMVERAMYWNNRGAGTDTIGGYSD